MTKFLEKSFSVMAPGTEQYRSNWDAIFAKKTLTRREVFERVKAHLLTQNARSENTSICLYRDDRNGRKCALGCLIADEHYDTALEGNGIYTNEVTRALEASGVDTTDTGTMNMLSALQSLHDGGSLCNWPVRLDTIEKSYLAE